MTKERNLFIFLYSSFLKCSMRDMVACHDSWETYERACIWEVHMNMSTWLHGCMWLHITCGTCQDDTSSSYYTCNLMGQVKCKFEICLGFMKAIAYAIESMWMPLRVNCETNTWCEISICLGFHQVYHNMKINPHNASWNLSGKGLTQTCGQMQEHYHPLQTQIKKVDCQLQMET